MVYIIILNWKGAEDTLACLNSLANLQKSEYRIIVCDNASPDGSYEDIRDGINENSKLNLIELSRTESENYVMMDDGINDIYLIQTGSNLGYAAGNNVGIRMALNQSNMKYVWVLNNDTVVDPFSLYFLLQRFKENKKIGICGSRLVYFHDKNKIQGLGGVINPFFCTSSHLHCNEQSDMLFDDSLIESKIDYIIGASMLIKKEVFDFIGLLSEEYFLYYEEIDFAKRANLDFSLGVASKSIVFHKEGASTGGASNQSTDAYYLKNKLLISKKYFPKSYWVVRFSYIVSMVNRLRRQQFENFYLCVRLFIFGK